MLAKALPLTAEMTLLGAWMWVDLQTAPKRRQRRLLTGMDEFMADLMERPTFTVRVIEAVPDNWEARLEAKARWSVIRQAVRS